MAKLSDKPTATLAALVGLDEGGNVRSMPVIDTAVSVKRISLPADLAWFQTAGYHRPADGGAARYVRTDSAGHLVSADGARWRVSELEPNVRMFGAVGDGVADDTDAIEAAHAYTTRSRYPAAKGIINLMETGMPLYFPPGRYRYSGAGLVQEGGNVVLLGVAGSTTIQIDADVYFLTANGIILNSRVSSLNFVGGRGAVTYTNTGANVTGAHLFEDCNFADYSVCAIGNNSTDHPYLKVRTCFFYGSTAGGTIGIAWGGYLDSVTIEDCSFLLNAYHLKLGPRIGGSVNITKNDFLAFRKNIRAADIWFVPSVMDVNSGAGIVIAQNKFGNENLSPDQPRILIAPDGDETLDRPARRPSEAWTEDKAFIRGIVLRENRFDGVSKMTAPIIRSFTPSVNALECTRNYFGGGIHTYLCEFMSADPTIRPNGPSDPKWIVELSAFSVPFSRDISNRAVGITLDPLAMMPSAPSALAHPSSSDDFDFVPLLQIDRGRTAAVALSAAAKPSADGAAVAGAAASGNRGTPALDEELDAVASGRASWLDLDVRSLDMDAPASFSIQINHSDTRITALRRRARAGSEWRRIRIPFVFPDAGSATGWRLVLRPTRASPALQLAHARVYHGNAPVASDNVRTLGSGRWDGGHLVLGDYHLWVDAGGQLRLKNGVPEGDGDGAAVGAT